MLGVASYLVFFLCVVLVLCILTMGLNLQWGFTGLFNAGVAGFYAIGGYTHAILTAAPNPQLMGNYGLPWLVGIIAAMLVTALAATLIGLITIRLRGDYLAIATFGIGIMIQLVSLNLESWTGASQGITRIPKPLATWFDAPLSYNLFYLVFMVAVVALVYWALERILSSPWGRVLRAIREDEAAASSLGKSPLSYRLQSFVLGSTLMGLAGALYVTFIGFVSPFDFLPILTFQVWAMLIVGGSGNNRGAMIGALVVWGIWAASGVAVSKWVPPSHAAQGAAIQVILIGLTLVLMLLYKPRGLIGERSVVSRHLVW
ncbi:MAG: branched-chain amino acid ABC transporter permease [Betaproteobacteria bacterium]|nr:branched-chain amino acid ABC transporter permease [Betaproteobacteria bacterium]